MSLIIVVTISLIASVRGVQWISSDNGQFRWAFDCDYLGGNIMGLRGSAQDCGPLCLSTFDCTRFSWTASEGGMCLLKSGDGQAFDTPNNGVCGEKTWGSPSLIPLGPVLPGKSTRYWDCCKPSCSEPDRASYRTHSPNTCKDDRTLQDDQNARDGCRNGGTSFICSNQAPWAINDTLSYGFSAAANIQGQQRDSSWCCACYALTFTSGTVAGKTLVVQVTSTGDQHLSDNHFVLQIPGGGEGRFIGCDAQWGAGVIGAPGGWNEIFGSVGDRNQCNQLPSVLQAGCQWRFDWFRGADNPSHNFQRVQCPKQITDRTGCIRSDEP